jgi:hypothetical protein
MAERIGWLAWGHFTLRFVGKCCNRRVAGGRERTAPLEPKSGLNGAPRRDTYWRKMPPAAHYASDLANPACSPAKSSMRYFENVSCVFL